MTRPILTGLHGESLDEALARCFSLAEESVDIGGRVVKLVKPANADHLITEADYVMDERLPYWADLWPSAHVLASTVKREHGTGRTLLEMGCGLGLATVGAMDAGFAVTATDYYDDALHVTRGNAARNLGVEPTVRMVNWREWPADLGLFDVVMAADVLYEKEYAILVGQCMSRALAPDGTALVADPGRLALPMFRENLGSCGLEIYDTTTTKFEQGAVKQEIQIMRLRHISAG